MAGYRFGQLSELCCDNILRTSGERRLSRKQFVCEDSQCVDVAAVINPSTGNLFRRHVGRRTDQHSTACHRRFGGVGRQQPCDPEIRQKDMTAG